MILLYVILSIANAAPTQTIPRKAHLAPCGVCKQERCECTKEAEKSPEALIETEECDNSYQECFNRNRCYVEGAR